MAAAEVPAGVETPVAPVSLPIQSILSGYRASLVDPRPWSMSVSPTELGEEIEHSKEQTATRFTSKMGNMEIVGGHTFIPRLSRFPPPTSEPSFLR